QEPLRGEVAGQLGDRVEIAGLGRAHGCALVQRGDPEDRDAVDATQTLQRGDEPLFPATQIGPEADVDPLVHADSRTGLRRVPIPSMSTSTRSPACRRPTPGGVPVEIRSPGSRVMMCDMNETSLAGEKTRSEVLPSCRTSPFTRQRTRRSSGFSPLTIHGPTQAKVS